MQCKWQGQCACACACICVCMFITACLELLHLLQDRLAGDSAWSKDKSPVSFITFSRIIQARVVTHYYRLF